MRRVLACFALLAAGLVVAPGATADDTTCMGTLPPGTYDNVVVPPNADCTLTSSVVLGDVLALQDARLFADSNDIRGNIQGDRADQIDIRDTAFALGQSVVGGDIQAVDGGGPTGAAFNPFVRVCGTELPNNGDIQVARFRPPASGGSSFVLIGDDGLCSPFGGGNSVPKGNIEIVENIITNTMGVDANQVGENLQIFKNTGPGAKTVNGNTVGESLQCFENSTPFSGTGNFARDVQGQCSAMPLP
jgi:hypothetical protein